MLTRDIDLTNLEFTQAVVGLPGRPFSGTFDGKGFCVRNLMVTGTYNLGLFGQVAPSGWVKNLGVVDVNVVGERLYIGGLAGENDGCIVNCFSTGSVTGLKAIGGLVGYSTGSVANCSSACAVTGDMDIGGLVGGNYGDIVNCYSIGAVTGRSGLYIGGLAGSNGTGNVISNSFWDMQTSNCTSSGGGMDLSTAQMQDPETFLKAGWDLVGESKNGTHETWQMPDGGGYPVLGVFHGYRPPQLRGHGTAGDPYLISTAAELGAVVWYDATVCYRLAADIDLAGIRWTTAVIPEFWGTFDGNDLHIGNLQIVGGGYLGLFGRLTTSAQVKDLSLVDVDVFGSGGPVGGLVGHNSGSLVHCDSAGAVAGQWSVGGLVGGNLGSLVHCDSACAISGHGSVGGLVGENSGSLVDCDSAGAVTGDQEVGGLVGTNYGSGDDCYGIGMVSGDLDVGGLAGSNYGSLNRCYSDGKVTGRLSVGGLVGSDRAFPLDPGVALNCFWDIETLGIPSSAGGTGLTTA